MTLTREELLLLLMYSSPKTTNGHPVVYGATRIQKLVFLTIHESSLLQQLCPEPYVFKAYDYGPYSSELDDHLSELNGMGWVQGRDAELAVRDVTTLSFEDLTSFMPKKSTDTYIMKGPAVKQATAVLTRLESEDVDTQKLLLEFRQYHERYGSMTVEDLLRYVYQKYRHMAVNTKRRDLLPDVDELDWGEGDDLDS